MNYSSTTVAGRLTRNAKVFAGNGKDKKGFVTFSVAVNDSKDRVTYFDVSAPESFSKIAQYLVAGKEVLVEGTIAINQFTKGDGTFAASLKLYANRVQLGSNVVGGSSSAAPGADDDSYPSDRIFPAPHDSDDIPY